MAGSLGHLNIQLELDQVKFQSGINNAQGRVKRFTDTTTKQLNNIERSMNSLNRVSANLFKAGIAGFGVNQLKGFADGYTEIQNKLRLVESASISSSKGLNNVFDIALKTNQSINATSGVYQRFAQNAETLKISQAQIASLTETVSKAVAVSGASAGAADAALTQFGQALGSGILRGDEFNSVMEQTPALAKAIATGLGVTTGELRNMAKEGKLTMDVLVPALERAKESVDDQFNTRILTISAAFENLNTSTIKWIGELDKSTGASEAFAKAINEIANHLTVVASLAAGAGVIWSVGKIRTWIAASIQASAAMSAQAAATRNLTAAQQALTATGKGLGSALGFVGGPLGLLTLGLSAGVGVFLDYQQKTESARQELLSFADSLDVTTGKLANTSAAVLDGMKAKLEQSITAQKDEIKRLEEEYEKLNRIIEQGKQIAQQSGKAEDTAYLEALAKSTQDLAIKKAELAKANEKLTKSEDDLKTIIGQVPVAEFHDKLKSLLPTLDMSKVNIDNIGFSLDDLNRIFPSAESGAASVTSAVERMGAMAVLVASQFNALGFSVQNALSDKATKLIERNNRQIAINKETDPTKKRRLQAEDAALNAGFEKGTADYDAYYKSNVDLFASQAISKAGSSKKSKGGKSSGGGSKVDYVKQFTDQLSEMEHRLSEIRANAQDISVFGQISQYQELNKITQDIAANGEKYAHFGADGLAKLKDMAAQIDAAQQSVAIAQFAYDNGEKLRAMEFELELLGKTRQEQELIQYNHQLDLEASRLKIGMSQENIAKLDEEIAKLKERRAVIQETENQRKSNPIAGIKDGVNQIQESVGDVAGNISQITQNAFNGMSDALTDFVVTGKADFRSMAQSILKDISAMIVKMMIFNAIKSAASAFGYSDGGYVGFASGGYTGDGGKYQPAGVVHRGEYVITKEATSRLGIGFLNHLNYGRGYATGGAVGSIPSTGYRPMAGGSISVKVINNGEPVNANVEQRQRNGETEITVELIRQIARNETNGIISNNMRSGGVFA
ncbi:tape measure protein [uncultured Haemophilus sp.]|uniref:tape measure protein n=1 Tax=uncultured Haemophilus sp. TaxID=237779 RepID=UPI0028064BBE|nr:tape measure protein [uncultured Haemophilus sp.]